MFLRWAGLSWSHKENTSVLLPHLHWHKVWSLSAVAASHGHWTGDEIIKPVCSCLQHGRSMFLNDELKRGQPTFQTATVTVLQSCGLTPEKAPTQINSDLWRSRCCSQACSWTQAPSTNPLSQIYLHTYLQHLQIWALYLYYKTKKQMHPSVLQF